MRHSPFAATDLKLVRSPNARHQAVRRRLMAVGAVVAMAAAGAALGYLAAPTRDATDASPFRYFPSE